jgi:hypothetical protein
MVCRKPWRSRGRSRNTRCRRHGTPCRGPFRSRCRQPPPRRDRTSHTLFLVSPGSWPPEVSHTSTPLRANGCLQNAGYIHRVRGSTIVFLKPGPDFKPYPGALDRTFYILPIKRTCLKKVLREAMVQPLVISRKLTRSKGRAPLAHRLHRIGLPKEPTPGFRVGKKLEFPRIWGNFSGSEEGHRHGEGAQDSPENDWAVHRGQVFFTGASLFFEGEDVPSKYSTIGGSFQWMT